MANNITTVSALFETFQNIMQGRKVAAREQNRAVQAMILQGMLNEVLNQRQLLRQEQSQLNAIEVQKKYDIMQTLISKKADLTKERMKIEAQEKEAREKVALTKLDPITGKLHQFNEYGQEISAFQLTPKPTDEDKPSTYTSLTKKQQMDVELAPLKEQLEELKKKRAKLLSMIQTDFTEAIVEGESRGVYKKGYKKLEGYEEAKAKIDLKRITQNINELQEYIKEISQKYGVEYEEPQPQSINDPFNWR